MMQLKSDAYATWSSAVTRPWRTHCLRAAGAGCQGLSLSQGAKYLLWGSCLGLLSIPFYINVLGNHQASLELQKWEVKDWFLCIHVLEIIESHHNFSIYIKTSGRCLSGMWMVKKMTGLSIQKDFLLYYPLLSAVMWKFLINFYHNIFIIHLVIIVSDHSLHGWLGRVLLPLWQGTERDGVRGPEAASSVCPCN